VKNAKWQHWEKLDALSAFLRNLFLLQITQPRFLHVCHVQWSETSGLFIQYQSFHGASLSLMHIFAH